MNQETNTLETKLLPENFDIDLFNLVAINPLQSWEWGETRKAIGKEVLRFGTFEKNKLISVYTVILYALPKVKYKIGHLIFSLIPKNSELEFIYQTLNLKDLLLLKIEPYIYAETKAEISEISKNWENELNLSHMLFSHAESRYMYEKTIILDLAKEESTLSKDLRKSTRYMVRNASTKLVQIEETENFTDFWTVFESTAKRQQYYAHDENYHIKVWEIMKKNISKIFLAKFDGDILAAFQIFFFNRKAYYVYSGSGDKNRQLGGSNLLMWETILTAKENGCKEFDLWGIGDKPSFRGFSSFKEGYGGRHVYLIDGIDIIFNKYLYFGYKYINKTRLLLRDLLRSD